MPLKIPFYLVVTNLMTVSIAFHIWALTFCENCQMKLTFSR